MKREFGKKLIEDFLPTVDLRTVIDTSGAYIPGHGTPTGIIVGRNRTPTSETVRAVLGIRGEPGKPDNPAKGVVWTAITQHANDPWFENSYISVADLARGKFAFHPWSLSGGGAVEVSTLISGASHSVLRQKVKEVGFGAVTREDSAYMVGSGTLSRNGVPNELTRPLVEGDRVRDWSVNDPLISLWPYDPATLAAFASKSVHRFLWPMKTILSSRVAYGNTQLERGLQWFEYSMFFTDRYRVPLSITFAFVATHNHFVLDRGGKVFNRSAPVIKLPEDASVEDHLRLLGVLNSSVACFWLKQNSYPKGGDPIGKDGARVSAESWSDRYEFTGTTLQGFPLPATTSLERAQLLDELAQQLQEQTPLEVSNRVTPTQSALEGARHEYDRLRGLMIAHQEELDWEYYRIYGLLDEDLTYQGGVPEIALGERAFEIALARRMKDGEETAWFERHGSTPITEIPDHLPADYQALLQRRLDVIESNPHIRLLERPEYKRRWAMEPWDKQVESALRTWLLDRVEDRSLWYDRDGRPTPQSVAQLADILDRNEDFRKVLRLWAGDDTVATGTALAKLLADQSVPFLAAYRYKPSGLEKRAAWEHTWELQRREDAGEKLDKPIPVPPKYRPTDFAKPSYWSHRGKLDVPKERFISYPNAGRDTDPTELLGWAGWDHADQALALAGLISARIDEGWDTPRLTPLLAGLNELLPWARQWHNEIDPEYGESVADTIHDELTARLAEHHLTVTDLTNWRPAPTTRKRKTKTS